MFVSKQFLRDLALIDKTWRVEVDESDGTFSVVKDVSVKIPLENGGVGIVHGPRTIAVFQGDPASGHLEELKRRKRWGEQMKIVENPLNELRYYQELNKKAKAEKKELALDMMTAGFMKMHKMATSQTFVMPGEKKWPTTSQPIPDSGASTPSESSRPQETKS